MDEEWKWINNYIGIYAISNCGKVYSYKSKRYRKATLSKEGYLYVTLHGNGKPLKKFIHTLVLETFVGPRPNNESIARHYPDQNKLNNNINNLSWSTPAQNARDRFETFCENTKFTEQDIIDIKNKLLYQNYTQADIVREYNVYPETISKIVHNEHWKDIGPDISNINFDKRRILTDLEVSQIKRAILLNMNTNTISSHFNIKLDVLNKIKNNISYSHINPCNVNDMPKIITKTHKQSKLSAEDVEKIKDLINNSQYTQTNIAKMFNVNSKTIYSIKFGLSHQNI